MRLRGTNEDVTNWCSPSYKLQGICNVIHMSSGDPSIGGLLRSWPKVHLGADDAFARWVCPGRQKDPYDAAKLPDTRILLVEWI
jgi:hypothetical protein